jgi:hypothetical protein
VFAEIGEDSRPHGVVEVINDRVGDQTYDQAVDDCASHESFSPNQRVDGLFRYVLKFIHDNGRSVKQTAHTNIQVKQRRPEKPERDATENTSERLSPEQSRDKSGDKDAEPECGKEIHHHAYRKSARNPFAATGKSKKLNSTKEGAAFERGPE